jgi:hypothetical protein
VKESDQRRLWGWGFKGQAVTVARLLYRECSVAQGPGLRIVPTLLVFFTKGGYHSYIASL